MEKRVLFSQDHASYSTYRSTEHFTSDDPSTLPPVIFPLSLTPDNLTSFPMVILNDNFTLVQPNLLLKSLEGGNYSLECLIRINGAVSGLPDISVSRQEWSYITVLPLDGGSRSRTSLREDSLSSR